ncbi:hypothetical protein IMSHALPRED_005866 [Imshaugia aleurites]|uniref:Uncharacterized protein n=1 Tax=Imshaugia aleurites TaxID=172621 RepID=A0A8H3FDA5_9LECA|nr:hypothetical protein IMSHALPRED_005866 [Imshaugia aleurites]
MAIVGSLPNPSSVLFIRAGTNVCDSQALNSDNNSNSNLHAYISDVELHEQSLDTRAAFTSDGRVNIDIEQKNGKFAETLISASTGPCQGDEPLFHPVLKDVEILGPPSRFDTQIDDFPRNHHARVRTNNVIGNATAKYTQKKELPGKNSAPILKILAVNDSGMNTRATSVSLDTNRLSFIDKSAWRTFSIPVTIGVKDSTFSLNP